MTKVIKNDPLHIQVYNIVKKMIVEGQYQPGERLVETKVSKLLKVSRGTIREAFRMLIKDELLVQKEGIVTVYAPSIQEIIDIYECRQTLESLAAKLATANINNIQLNELKLIIEESREALISQNSSKLIMLNQQFHDIIAEASQNKQLIQLFEVINAKIIYIRNCILSGIPESYSNLVNDHEQIYQALKNRNPLESEQSMHLHIQRSLDIAKESLKKKSGNYPS